MDLLAYRTGVYGVLAELSKEPDENLACELPAMAEYLTEAFAALEYPLPDIDWQDWQPAAAGLEKLQADYRRSFLYPPESRVVPVESVYRQWTFDPTAKLPFAREKGYLMSDAALHMKALYEGFGLTIPAEMKATPDHLCLELEFAGFLLENETAERYATFLREHLDWIGELSREAVKQEIASFYRQALAVTDRFVDCELDRYGR
jgi:TorA maturation chaperone TorD